MINPNAISQHEGIVTEVHRSNDKSLNITVLLVSGHEVQELGFVYHQTVKVGDLVTATIGFSIMSDRYGVKSIRVMRPGNKRYERTLTKLKPHVYAMVKGA